MRRLLAIAIATGFLSHLYADDGAYQDDQRMLQKAAARRTPAPAPRAAAPSNVAKPAAAKADVRDDQLSQEERKARADAALAQARLELVLAKKALQAGEFDAAAAKSKNVLVLLRIAGQTGDTGDVELQAEGILAKAERAGGKANGANAGDTGAVAAESQEGRVDVTVTSPGRPHVVRRSPLADDFGYRASEPAIDRQAILARDQPRLLYEEALDDANREVEASRTIAAHQMRSEPDALVTYPEDWPQKMAARQQYDGGMIARTPSWRDKDGREWFIAVYDIHDLIYEPPDFGYGVGLDPAQAYELSLDRDAIRNNGWLFRGDFGDLREGFPLLRYFGGYSDNVCFSTECGYPWDNSGLPGYFGAGNGYRYSLKRQQEIVDMIRAFTGMKDPDDVQNNPAPTDVPQAPAGR